MSIYAVDANMHITNQVIEYRDRPEGSTSKLNTFSDGFRVIGTIIKLFADYRPLQFFGWIAVILAAIAVGFFIPVMQDYMHTGLVARFPTLIVCGFCGLAALISFFSGLILSSNRNKDKRDFEFKLQSADRWYKEVHEEDK